jgi:phage terminase large subunit
MAYQRRSGALRPEVKPGPEAALAKLIEIGRRDAVEFVRLSFGAEPSSQQKDALEKVVKLEEALQIKAMGHELPESHRDMAGKMGISIRSGNGTGKDAFLAWMIIRLVVCFPRPKGMATAPAAHQLESIVWAEVTRWLNCKDNQGNYICPFRDLVSCQATKIFWKPGGGKESFVEPRTASPTATDEAQSETLAGRHEDFLTIFCTEASGVPDAVFKPLERTLTGRCNYAILAWNPTRTKGYAYRTHFSDDRKSWVTLHWNAEESERVSKEHIARMAEKFGRDSNMYRIGVLGIPPVSEKGTLIPYEVAFEAIGRDLEVPDDTPTRLGGDIGRSGDPTGFLARTGPRVDYGKNIRLDDLVMVSASLSGEMAETEAEHTFIDVNGIGWGVYDLTRKNHPGRSVIPVNITRAASQPKKFYQLRDELYWKVRQAFMDGTISITPGPWVEDFMAELTSIKFDDDVKGQGGDGQVIKIWSKKQMKQKGLPSPNLVDALALTYYLPETYGKKAPTPDGDHEDRWKERFRNHRSKRDYSWMGV